MHGSQIRHVKFTSGLSKGNALVCTGAVSQMTTDYQVKMAGAYTGADFQMNSESNDKTAGAYTGAVPVTVARPQKMTGVLPPPKTRNRHHREAQGLEVPYREPLLPSLGSTSRQAGNKQPSKQAEK